MSIVRQHLVRRASALILLLTAVPTGMVALASPAAAAPLATACPDGHVEPPGGNTYVLDGPCNVTAPVTVPDGVTLDGNGNTISATDAGGPQWNGGIVTNAGASMNIRNLTITGPAAGFQLCTISTNVLYGIFFNDAGGTVDNVTVDHIFQFQNGAFGSCQTGRAIRADGLTAARTVTITNTTVQDYQKSGFEARGLMDLHLSGSTAGPPHPLEGLISQNGVSLVGTTSGTVENNTIHGSSDQAPGPGGFANGTAMLLSNADNATVNENTFIGLGTDIGIAVSAGSTGNTISFNDVTRTASENPANTDPTGIGINVDPDSLATLICNTFDGWRPDRNIVGAIQINCTPLPAGTECESYSAHTPAVQGGPDAGPRTAVPRPALRPALRPTPPVTWTLEAGDLPPGLELAEDGAITGTLPPGSAGTYAFTVRATEGTGLTATHDTSIRVGPGCAAAPSTPVVRTATSHDRVPPGSPFYDRIHVRRLAGGNGATAVARLYGPFTSRAAATCTSRFRVRTRTLHVHNGWNRTPAVRVAAPGVYTWKVTLRANAANRSATHRCGQAVETTMVAKPPFVSPIVDGGFSGTIRSFARASAPVRISMPAIGMHAPVRTERIVDGEMTLPGNVGEVGWLRRSAGFGDKIGKAVVGGHVSDRHDSPGAMFHLSKARAGQRITVTQAGKVSRFKVVSKATFDRRQKLPHRYFATTGPHRLVLISCTAKVVSPSGRFHYTRYIVVVAKQIRHHR